MSRYDGLIIPRSYSEYINKTDAATLQQALQLSGVLSGAVAAGDNKAVKSSAVYEALTNYINKTDAATLQQALQLSGVLSEAVAAGDNKAVKSSAVYEALTNYINKTDAETLQQALQLPGVLSEAVAAGDNKAVKSSAVNNAIANLKYFHKNSLSYDLKIKIMEKVSEKGEYFNAIFSWSSYGSGNFISMHLLRFNSTDITTVLRINGNTPTDTANFKIENDDLYFYPNGDTAISGGGGAYILLLS